MTILRFSNPISQQGQQAKNWVSISGDYTVASDVDGVFVSATGNVLVTIPNSSVVNNAELAFKRTDNNKSFSVTISGVGANIDDKTSQNISIYDAMSIASDGTSWYII